MGLEDAGERAKGAFAAFEACDPHGCTGGKVDEGHAVHGRGRYGRYGVVRKWFRGGPENAVRVAVEMPGEGVGEACPRMSRLRRGW